MIENPQTGLLKDQLCMWGIPYKDIDYCKYGLIMYNLVLMPVINCIHFVTGIRTDSPTV